MSFKLPDFLDWALLNSLRNEMQAPLANNFINDHQFKPIEIPIHERLRSIGVDVNIDEISVHSDGTITYHDFRVLLYIRDLHSMGRQDNMPRYHLAYCQTLEKMQKNNRFDRYVVSNNDTGIFQVNIIDGEIKSQSVKLNVCQNCLDRINWQGFGMQKMSRHERLQLVSKFSLVDFFNVYPRDLISVKPRHTSDTAPLNDYSNNWPSISRTIKNIRGNQCEICRIILKNDDSKYLHVHHRNGQKNNNEESNLEVLCIACHSEQPMHGHLQKVPQYKEFMSKYRR